MTKALFEQEDAFMWVILDSQNYPTGDEKNHFNESINELVSGGRAYKADTLEDLADQIGADPNNLVKAVEDFNAHVDSKEADEFGRTLYQWKIDKLPYYAGARVPTVHHTMGGIEINTQAQVIDTEGNIIPGLYAAGEVTGGIHGSNRLGGNALADINVFGRIAGRNAAAFK
jgi:urocanate reductase